MAPKYKLTYFDLTGLGEPIRLLFRYGGIEFEDNRVSPNDWPKVKSSTPLGQMPILEVDGRTLHQSSAIARYVAKQVGLAGDDDLEAYEIDAAVETVQELRISIANYIFELDTERKRKVKTNLDTEKLPFLLSKLDGWAKQNNGYLANGKLSWADLFFYGLIGLLGEYVDRDLLADYPSLQDVKENVLSVPAIKTWVDERPADDLSFLSIYMPDKKIFGLSPS